MIYNQTKYNEGWAIKKLDNLGVFSRGKSKHRPRNDSVLFEGGGYPLVQTGDVRKANPFITSHTSEYNEVGLAQSKLWEEGTLCITIAANIAETGILSYPMCFPDSVVGFQAYKGETTEMFMHYVFTFIRHFIKKSVVGSIQDNINLEYLQNLDFRIPPKPYQDKIVKVLSSFDNKIRLNNEIIEKLTDLSQDLFNRWFIQFEFPNGEGKSYKEFDGEMEWNDDLQKEIPKGWKSENLYFLADYINGIACQKFRPAEGESGIPVIKIKEMHEGITSETEYVSNNINDKNKVYAGDILFSWSATLEVMYWLGKNGGLNQHIFKVVPKSYFTKEYVYSQLSAYIINFVKIAETRKTTMGHITTDHLKQSYVAIPPEKYVKQFTNIVAPFHEKIKICSLENLELISMRDDLLQSLMKGEVTV